MTSSRSRPVERSEPAVRRQGAACGGEWKSHERNRKKRRPGSGIPARKIIVGLVWARRIAQAGFLGLFLFFLCNTAFRGTFSAGSDTPVRLPWPVEGFLLDGSVRRGDDALVDAHCLSWSRVVARRARVDARVRTRVLRVDLPVRYAASLLRVDLPVALRPRQSPRRGEPHARLAARQVLPAGRVPRRRGLRQRHRRALRPDLHRRACDRPRRAARAAVPRYPRRERCRRHERTRSSNGERRVPRFISRAPSGPRIKRTFTRRGSSRSCSSRFCS